MWDNLPQDVKDELLDEDPRFKGRQHYSRSTYALGCHGPLCRKAERDRTRRRTEARAKGRGKAYVPNLKLRETRKVEERDDELNRIIEWHLADRKSKSEATQEKLSA